MGVFIGKNDAGTPVVLLETGSPMIKRRLYEQARDAGTPSTADDAGNQ